MTAAGGAGNLNGSSGGKPMSVFTLDADAAAALYAMKGQIELRGPDGTLLGRFMPAPRPGMSFPELGLTDAELEARRTDPNAKWYTPEEVMARLRELDGRN